MSIDFNCPSCRKAFSVADETAGRKATCNACGSAFTIPAPPTTMSLDLQDEEARLSPVVVPPPKYNTNIYEARPKSGPWFYLFLLTIVAGLLVGGYFYMTRDTWEIDNKTYLSNKKKIADNMLMEGSLEKADEEYNAILATIGIRNILDKEIKEIVSDTNDKIRLVQLKQKQKTFEERQRANEEQEALQQQKEKEKQLAAEQLARDEERMNLGREQAKAEAEKREQLELEARAEQRKKEEELRAQLIEQQKKAEELQQQAELDQKPDPNNQPVQVKPEDKKALTGELCTQCIGGGKGTLSLGSGHYSSCERLHFKAVENGRDNCPTCEGKGTLLKVIAFYPEEHKKNYCKNCDGCGRIAKYKPTGKWYGFPFGKSKCPKCNGTGLDVGSVRTGK